MEATEITVDYSRFIPTIARIVHGPEGNCPTPEECDACALIDEKYE